MNECNKCGSFEVDNGKKKFRCSVCKSLVLTARGRKAEMDKSQFSDSRSDLKQLVQREASITERRNTDFWDSYNSTHAKAVKDVTEWHDRRKRRIESELRKGQPKKFSRDAFAFLEWFYLNADLDDKAVAMIADAYRKETGRDVPGKYQSN